MSSAEPATRSSSPVGYYQSIESFALVDGPGVRSVLFLQGCPFRCLYCHNPDTWPYLKINPITPEEALSKLIRYRPYWKNNGGVTVSGGEPLSQIDFLLAFAKLLKKENISFVIDTAGGPFTYEEAWLSKFEELLKYTSLIMLDIKTVDEELHRKITGVSNKHVLEMFDYLGKIHFPIWARHVLVPGLTDDDVLLKETADFLDHFDNIQKREILPYHDMARFKYEKLGIPYPLENTQLPTKERIENAKRILKAQ